MMRIVYIQTVRWWNIVQNAKMLNIWEVKKASHTKN